MYVLITSKPDEYQAILSEGLNPVKQFEYYYFNKRRSVFTIAEVTGSGARVVIEELGENGTRNSIPVKFFESFETVEAAEAELASLAQAGAMDTELVETQVA